MISRPSYFQSFPCDVVCREEIVTYQCEGLSKIKDTLAQSLHGAIFSTIVKIGRKDTKELYEQFLSFNYPVQDGFKMLAFLVVTCYARTIRIIRGDRKSLPILQFSLKAKVRVTECVRLSLKTNSALSNTRTLKLRHCNYIARITYKIVPHNVNDP